MRLNKIFRNIKTFLDFIIKTKNGYLVILDYLGFFKPKKPYILKLRNGLKFYIENWKSAGPINSIILLNEYQINLKNNQKEIYIDIGGHIGTFSLFAAKLNPNRKILCFEPNKDNFKILKKNITLNKINNINSFQLAVYRTSGNQFMGMDKEKGSQSHSLIRDFKNKIKIKTISLKDLFRINKIKKCDYLKIDAEGAEYDIISSTPLEIFKKIKKIFLEYHDIKNHNYQEIIDNLKNTKLYHVQHIKIAGKGHIIAIQK